MKTDSVPMPAHSRDRILLPGEARLGLVFLAAFAAIGFIQPFLPALLSDRGIGPKEIGTIIACATLARLVIGPAAGWLADRVGDPRPILAIAALAAAAAAASLGLVTAAWASILVALLLHLSAAPVVPMCEAAAQAEVRASGARYGRIRVWGSVALMGSVLLAGFVVEHVGLSPLALISASGFTCLAAAAMWSGGSRPPATRRPGGGTGFLEIMRLPGVLPLLAFAALLNGSHAFVFSFSAIAWRTAGLGGDTIGMLLALSVAAEASAFLMLGGWVARQRVARVATLAAAAASVRWFILGTPDVPVWLAGGAQLLHGLTFALAHLLAIRFITVAVPGPLASRAVALYVALASVLPVAAATFASGWLYASFGAQGFWAMAALSLLAIPAGLRLRMPSTAG